MPATVATNESARRPGGAASSQGQEGRRKPAFLTSLTGRDATAAFLLVGPLMFLFAVSVLYPLVETVRLSFFDIRGVGAAKFIGLNNYLRLAADPNFIHSMGATLQWTLASTVISVSIGWGLALLCSLAPARTLPFRVMIFAAYGVAEAVSGFMWLDIYRPDAGGLLNALLAVIGLGQLQTPWLGNGATAMWAVIVAYSWTQVGLPLMTCFASIRAIPSSLMEAAHIDGASPMRMLRYIVMPLSMPGVRVAIFINLLASLKAFDLIFILTGGGPVRSTETVGYFMYRESMQNFKLGYGAASTVVLLVAVLLVSVPAILKRTQEAK